MCKFVFTEKRKCNPGKALGSMFINNLVQPPSFQHGPTGGGGGSTGGGNRGQAQNAVVGRNLPIAPPSGGRHYYRPRRPTPTPVLQNNQQNQCIEIKDANGNLLTGSCNGPRTRITRTKRMVGEELCKHRFMAIGQW